MVIYKCCGQRKLKILRIFSSLKLGSFNRNLTVPQKQSFCSTQIASPAARDFVKFRRYVQYDFGLARICAEKYHLTF